MMRVFVAGASGAIGTRLVPQLIDRGHEVTRQLQVARTRRRVRTLGAEPIALDLFDARAVRKAAKARRVLGWTPRYPSWRQGFVAAYASATPTKGRESDLAASR